MTPDTFNEKQELCINGSSDRVRMETGTVVYLTGPISRAAGGLFDAIRNLALAIEEQYRYKPSVMGLREPKFECDRPLWGNIETNAFRVSGPGAFGYAPELSGALRRKSPDLLHVHGLWMYPSVAAIRWSARSKPYVVSPHGMLDPWAVRNSRWKKRISALLYENRHLRGAACLHALNEAEAESMRAYGLKNSICIIPNGVELPEQERASCPQQKRTLLYLGRLHPKKGLPSLIQAWSKVEARARASGWCLQIAGWDQNGHQSALEELAARLNVHSTLSFIGPQFGEAKANCFRTASAFVLPSLSEGLPMSVLEAWSWRLPALITSNCNLSEGTRAGAAIAMEANEESIAAALNRLFSMSCQELKQMGSLGRRLVEERFQWPYVAEQMTQVYDWILNQGPQPSCILN
jgi:poly(glycerol-phosphate) alpha-glucosyltransferase